MSIVWSIHYIEISHLNFFFIGSVPGFKPKTPLIQERPQEEVTSLTSALSPAKQTPAASASSSARAAVRVIPEPDEDETGESSHAGETDGAATAGDGHAETNATYNASISDEGEIEQKPWDESVEQAFEDDDLPEEEDEDVEMGERENDTEDKRQDEEESEFHDAR